MGVITKSRDGNGTFGPRWRIYIDGRRTTLCVERGERPKYREPQTWNVFIAEDDDGRSVELFECRSLEGALSVIETISEALQPKDNQHG